MNTQETEFPELVLLNNKQIPEIQQTCFQDVIYSNLKRVMGGNMPSFSSTEDFFHFFKKKLPIVFGMLQLSL